MTLFSGLVRRVAAEAERPMRAGLGLLARLDGQGRIAELEAVLPALHQRIAVLEQTLRTRDAEVRELRAELASLVNQLNDRLLPRIDERMDDTERDLTMLATGQVRIGKETAANRTSLDALDHRLAELRTRLLQMEQRSGLWRELQADMARLGDDVDTLRTRVPGPVALADDRHVEAARERHGHGPKRVKGGHLSGTEAV
ncbi:hypothetical protein [Spirillospora sp. CA-294931]|uniref:hypothetical protein n=1 Tax=Spirillospora sp. CA-294931 TaxID=3240042 RepID=UPI003D932932